VLLPVQPQSAGEPVQDGTTGIGLLALLEPDVVVDRQAGERGDLFTAQPGRPPRPGASGQADIAGAHARPAGSQEFAKLIWLCHVSQSGSRRCVQRGPVTARNAAVFPATRRRGIVGSVGKGTKGGT
jgi:hypothetical protein